MNGWGGSPALKMHEYVEEPQFACFAATMLHHREYTFKSCFWANCLGL